VRFVNGSRSTTYNASNTGNAKVKVCRARGSGSPRAGEAGQGLIVLPPSFWRQKRGKGDKLTRTQQTIAEPIIYRAIRKITSL
jgi:hypothetical protein